MLLSVLQTIKAPEEIPEWARSCDGARVGLLYRAGNWEAAHAAAQDLGTAEGSFWHGILHRQERDWGNAAYWFRRVGQHPVYPALQAEAARIVRENPVAGWQLGKEWDAVRFVDWCEQAAGHPGSAAEHATVQIQAAEWRLLFSWCLG